MGRKQAQKRTFSYKITPLNTRHAISPRRQTVVQANWKTLHCEIGRRNNTRTHAHTQSHRNPHWQRARKNAPARNHPPRWNALKQALFAVCRRSCNGVCNVFAVCTCEMNSLERGVHVPSGKNYIPLCTLHKLLCRNFNLGNCSVERHFSVMMVGKLHALVSIDGKLYNSQHLPAKQKGRRERSR